MIHFLGIWFISIVLGVTYGAVLGAVLGLWFPDYYYGIGVLTNYEFSLAAPLAAMVDGAVLGAIGGFLAALCAIRSEFCPRRFTQLAVKRLSLVLLGSFLVAGMQLRDQPIVDWLYDHHFRHELGKTAVAASYGLSILAIVSICWTVLRDTGARGRISSERKPSLRDASNPNSE